MEGMAWLLNKKPRGETYRRMQIFCIRLPKIRRSSNQPLAHYLKPNLPRNWSTNRSGRVDNTRPRQPPVCCHPPKSKVKTKPISGHCSRPTSRRNLSRYKFHHDRPPPPDCFHQRNTPRLPMTASELNSKSKWRQSLSRYKSRHLARHPHRPPLIYCHRPNRRQIANL